MLYGTGVGGSGCTYVWKAVAHRHVSGGLRHRASTIVDCQAACVNKTSCVGVDFNNQRQCYLILAGVPGEGLPIIIGEDEDKKESEEHGCVHYDLKRTCGSGESVVTQLILSRSSSLLIGRLVLTLSFPVIFGWQVDFVKYWLTDPVGHDPSHMIRF